MKNRMRPSTLTRASALALLLGFGLQAQAADGDTPSTTPYRPSVSTPAALSAPGWLEIEAGFTHAHAGDDAVRDSVPTTFKLAFTPDWGVRVGSDAWVRQRDGDTHASGFGDTSLVLKRRFAVDEHQAFGLEGGVTLPTSRHDLGPGSGKADYGLNAIYSADIGDWHTDINLAATRLGQVDEGSTRTQGLWAASLSRALDDQWGVVGEFSGTYQRGAGSTRQFLMAASYNVSKQVTLDAGAARSLRAGPPEWSAFTGLTWLAARLF